MKAKGIIRRSGLPLAIRSAVFLAVTSVLAAGISTPGMAQLDSAHVKIAESPAGFQLPANATASDISNARIFDEPLLPVGGVAGADENRALAASLTAYANRTNLDDFSSLTGFVAGFPQSSWTPSLLLHLGVEYYNFGYYSRALDAWEQSWQEFRAVNDPKIKPQADRALGELVRMYSKLGRMTELKTLLDECANRALSGPATQMVSAAKEALWMMQNQPEFCFRCGPLALDRIRSHADPARGGDIRVLKSKSTTNGFSLAQVAALSGQLGMNYQMAFRSPGAPLIVPAVAHWKVGHYAALTERNGNKFLAEDYTFQGAVWMSMTAIDNEASGYFLVPAGTLPRGWRAVSAGEGGSVWGRGLVNGQDQNATTHCDRKVGDCPGISNPLTGFNDLPTVVRNDSVAESSSLGMTTYTMSAMLVSLALDDTPVGYTPPVGPPVRFTATYNQLEANQPSVFYYSNLGPDWTCNWIAYITDNPTSPTANVSYYVDGGGTLTFSGYNSATQTYANELMSQAQLAKTSSSSYEMRFPDGSKKEFALSDGSTGTVRRIFLTQLIDAAGNSVSLNYDSSLRITNIVDAIGQQTAFSYTNTSYPLEITSVTDPFGRTARFQYGTNGLLAQITDELGLTSAFTYTGTNDSIIALTTPYGTTTFSFGTTNGVEWLQATDPLGESELLEFNQNSSISMSDPVAIVPHGLTTTDTYLLYRNCFFWNKKAFAEAPGDITKARLFHWLHTPDGASASRVLESEKQAFENRVWYNYPGQTVSIYQANVTMNNPSIAARVLDDGTTQLYAYQYNSFGNVTNVIDPVGRNFTLVYSTNNVDLLQARMTHNSKNQLLLSATYNSQHLPLNITDAAGQTFARTYNSRGEPLTITDPLGETTTFTYDTNGYLLAMTGPLQTSNDVTTFTYDSFGRLQTLTDPAGYTLTFSYDAMDRKTQITYPDGTYDQFVYSNLDLTAIRDRLGRWTTNTYNADRQLVQTRDPLGRIMTYDWCKCGAMTGLTDPMERTTSWDYDVQGRPTTKHFPDGSTITYTYEATTSRLKDRRDEKGQDTTYEYYSDNNLKRISYPNAATPTSTVTFTYDPDFNRVLTMQDGIGTTTYSYNPVTPVPALGALLLASVSGPLPDSAITFQYDALGRVVNQTIDGVPSSIVYDAIERPVTVSNALGSFQYAYADSTGRLASESYPNGQTSLYSYYGNPGDQRLQQITHLAPGGGLLSASGYAYDAFGHITRWTNQWNTLPTRVRLAGYDAADELVSVSSSGGPSPVVDYTYAYDQAGNRLAACANGSTNQYTYNSLNQLVSGPATTNATFVWDAENRLTSVIRATSRTDFVYDGLGRRVRIIQSTNGAPVSTNQFLWSNTQICEQRDASGSNVVKRFFIQGEQWIGTGPQPVLTNYYYTRDSLGSVLDVLDTNGLLAARYDYDPFGQQSIVQETTKATFGYTGGFQDAGSGLSLTLYRALDTSTGRWLSRDPLGENAAVNLYDYVGNDPLDLLDPLGLRCVDVYIWRATAPFGTSVGHVMVTEHNSTEVLLSQFPHDVNGGSVPKGPNTTLSYDDTFTEEGNRMPTTIFTVNVPDDKAFDNSVAAERALKTWDWFPTAGQTHCADSAWNALLAGGVPLSKSSPWWPSVFGYGGMEGQLKKVPGIKSQPGTRLVNGSCN